mgnify:CR=1 FL=1
MRHLTHIFPLSRKTAVKAVDDVSFQIRRGEIFGLVGESGSGKSTLLQCLGGLDVFDSGRVIIDGEDLGHLAEKERTILRNRKLGFVYQFHHLLPEFTALPNIAMPLRIRRDKTDYAENKALELLGVMGLWDRKDHLPSQLSGGERQRVAIARATVGDPVCLLADEPTGNLDQDTALSVFDYLLKLARMKHTAVVIVTHDMDLARRCDRILRLKDGRISDDSIS